MINLCFCLNERYAKYLPACLCSIFENNPNEEFRIYILTDGLSEHSVCKINKLHQKFTHFELIVRTIENDEIEQLNFNRYAYPQIIYLRLLIERELSDVDKVLSLDVDLFVLDSLKPLYEADLGNKLLAGIAHNSDPISSCCAEKDRSKNGIIQDEESFIYIGVTLLDLAKMRAQEKGSEYLLSLMRAPEVEIMESEQQIYNKAFRGQVKYFDRNWLYYYVAKSEKKIDFSKIHILHSNLPKPWFAWKGDPFGKYAWRYFLQAKRIIGDLGYKLPRFQWQELIINKPKSPNIIRQCLIRFGKMLPAPVVRKFYEREWRLRRK
jgi:lipopolysaccharide biosynthesis glycosyltransferase